jgi:DNA invertase Pin-like site-specific DNA recombinase
MSRKQPGNGGSIDIYARESKARSKIKVTTISQVKACRAVLLERGLREGLTFIDDSTSGWNPKVYREDWEAMMARLESGESAGVIVYDLNRFTRQLFTDGKRMIDAAKNGALVLDSEGEYDLRNYRDRSRFIQAIERAEYQSAQISDFVSRGLRDNATAGLFTGGPRIWGFKPDGVTIRELQPDGTIKPGSEADWINRAADMVIEGYTLTAVCRMLNDNDILNDRQRKSGNGWLPNNLRAALVKPRMAGFAAYKGGITGDAPYPAIIPRDKWRKLCDVVAGDKRGFGRRHTGGPGPKPQYLGSLIYRCGECLQMGRDEFFRGGKTAYYCKRGDHPGPWGGKTRPEGGFVIQSAPIDDLVVAEVTDTLQRPGARQLLAKPKAAENSQITALYEEEDRLRRKQDEINDMYENDPDYPIDQWKAVSVSLQQKRDDIRTRRERMEYKERSQRTGPLQGIAGQPNAREIWETLPLERKREIISYMFDVIIYRPYLRPGNGHPFDPECISLEPIKH